MSDNVVFGLMFAGFFVIVIGLTILHYRVNGDFKIEVSYLAIGLCPAVLWLLSHGNLQEFSGFGLEFKLNQVSNSKLSMSAEGDKISPETISIGDKGEASPQELIRRRVSALEFKLKQKGRYSQDAVQQYLKELIPHAFFQYVVFTEDGEFHGLIRARDLFEQTANLVSKIEAGTIDGLVGLQTAAVSTSSTKRDALDLMDSKDVSLVPVVDDSKKFVGIVEREKLTSNILLQLVTKR